MFDMEIDGQALHDSLPRGQSGCSLRLKGQILVARMPSGEVLKLPLREAELQRGGVGGTEWVFSSTVAGGPTFVTKNGDLGRAANLAWPRLGQGGVQKQAAKRQRLSTFQKVALAGATAVVLSLLGAVLLVGPLARVVLRFVPRSSDVRIGQTAYSHAVQQISWGDGLSEAAAIREPVQAVLDRVTAAIPACPFNFRVTVCRSSMLNASALPGGEILVTTRMLTSLTSAEELAALLAHEVNHVLRRHGMELTIKMAGLRFLLHMVSGGHVAAGLASGVWGAVTLMEQVRDKESEADRLAVRLLADARLDPKALISMFDRLATTEPRLPDNFTNSPPGKFLEKLNSHLQLAERAVDVQAEMAKIPSVAPELITIDYSALVKAVLADQAAPPTKSEE
jgi:Zn-dependent protease with chaperone function